MDRVRLDIKAVNKRADRRKRNETQEFGEMMPGYMNQSQLFNQTVEDELTQSAKTKLLKNVAILLGLLFLQIAFFYLLIQYSLSLTV